MDYSHKTNLNRFRHGMDEEERLRLGEALSSIRDWVAGAKAGEDVIAELNAAINFFGVPFADERRPDVYDQHHGRP